MSARRFLAHFYAVLVDRLDAEGLEALEVAMLDEESRRERRREQWDAAVVALGGEW